MRISALIIAISLAAVLAGPAFADPGNGNGGGNGNGNGGGNAGGQGSENSGNANAGSGNNSGNGNGRGNTGNTGNQVTKVPKDQNVAREAVKKREVLSLETVTTLVGETTKGRVLDVELVRLAGVYLYEVTVLESDGRLHKLYYNARSGALVDN